MLPVVMLLIGMLVVSVLAGVVSFNISGASENLTFERNFYDENVSFKYR